MLTLLMSLSRIRCTVFYFKHYPAIVAKHIQHINLQNFRRATIGVSTSSSQTWIRTTMSTSKGCRPAVRRSENKGVKGGSWTLFSWTTTKCFTVKLPTQWRCSESNWSLTRSTCGFTCNRGHFIPMSGRFIFYHAVRSSNRVPWRDRLSSSRNP